MNRKSILPAKKKQRLSNQNSNENKSNLRNNICDIIPSSKSLPIIFKWDNDKKMPQKIGKVFTSF